MAVQKPKKSALDKDLDRMTFVEHASVHVRKRSVGIGLGAVFVGLVMIYAGTYAPARQSPMVLVIAAALAAYMAMNIGANDVTNNTGAAVGARAMTMRQALIMAAVFEILGAVIAGREVTGTISSGVVNATTLPDGHALTAIMIAALMAAAVWINLATWLNAPVSTTHSIVGAIIGAATASTGIEVVEWRVIGEIVISWIASPLIGGLIAAALLFFIEETILNRRDRIAAGRFWVPLLIALMAAAFGAYITLQFAVRGHIPHGFVLPLGMGLFFATWLLTVPAVRRASEGLDNRNESFRVLFRFQLIASSALLCFAHGANDVSNAIGPLSAIVNAATPAPDGNATPLWALLIGAFGISVGLLLYGPRLIVLVGEQITRLNPVRSYCVSLSAALTVLTASWAGLPVSSTHIAVGSVFGVGFFREWYVNSWRPKPVKTSKPADDREAPVAEENTDELRRRRLVRRSHFMTIVGAWIITLPASAGVAALFLLVIRPLMP